MANSYMQSYVREELMGGENETETRQERNQKRDWSISRCSGSLLDSVCAELDTVRDENNEIRVGACVDNYFPGEKAKSWMDSVLEVEYCSDKSNSNDSFVSGML